MPKPGIVIEIIGEGKTDLGPGGVQPEPPNRGVVPVFVHGLCDRPSSMQVRRRRLAFLDRGGLMRKLRFAKSQAFYSGSAGLVFVLDTEGNHPGLLKELLHECGSTFKEYPAAVGVAHPCIEAWLLADAPAISRAMELAKQPDVPAEPESLPAPCKNRDHNPKVLLGRCAGLKHPLSSAETTRIAHQIRNLDTIRNRCPTSFAPFADEVVRRIKPIFETNGK